MELTPVPITHSFKYMNHLRDIENCEVLYIFQEPLHLVSITETDEGHIAFLKSMDNSVGYYVSDILLLTKDILPSGGLHGRSTYDYYKSKVRYEYLTEQAYKDNNTPMYPVNEKDYSTYWEEYYYGKYGV